MRWTRPPSWSVAMSSGNPVSARAARCSPEVRAVVWAGLSTLPEDNAGRCGSRLLVLIRMMPPGCQRRTTSAGVATPNRAVLAARWAGVALWGPGAVDVDHEQLTY